MLRPTTSPGNQPISKEQIQIEYNTKKRQDQIDLFYLTGRKIHNVTLDTIHMRNFRNEMQLDDNPPWNRILRCRDDSDRGGRRWKIDKGIPNNPGGQRAMSTKSAKSAKSDSRYIIEGYNGIMPLNMTDIPRPFRKQALEQHSKNIKDYTREQAELPERMRYENTVMRVERLHRMESAANAKRQQDAIDTQTRRYERLATERRKTAANEAMTQLLSGNPI